MRVSRLEVFGFKSFLDKLTLPLESGFTGVVGPNGCGKSNIVDALRWVLGETRASQLRGGTLEDVIFNGTDTLRPLGLAEVTITLRSTESDFFSEIVANLKKGALATLQLGEGAAEVESPAASESVEGAPSNEQGQVGERPKLTVIDGALAERGSASLKEERGVVSEDSALNEDTVAHEEGSSDAEALPEVNYILSRFRWLRDVQEVQITRRLYRSGESEFFINRVQCRLKDLKELFRAVGLGARAYTIVAQGEVSRIISAKPEERRLIVEEAAGVAGFRDKISAAQRRLDETSANITRLDDVIVEVTRQVNSLRVQASRARNRAQLKERLELLDKQLFTDSLARVERERMSLRSIGDEIRAQLAQREVDFQTASSQEHEMKGTLFAKDVEGDSIRVRIDSIQEELRVRSQRRESCSSRTVEVKSEITSQEGLLQSLDERAKILGIRQEEVLRELRSLEQLEEQHTAEIAELGAKDEDALKRATEILHSAREELKVLETRAREKREEFIRTEAEIKGLEEQLVRLSPLSQLRDLARENGALANLIRSPELDQFLADLSTQVELLSNGISIDGRYAKALQAALGVRASSFIGSEPHRMVARLAELVRKARTLAPSDEGGYLPDVEVLVRGENAIAPSQGSEIPFPRLLSLLRIQPGFGRAAAWILENTCVAETREEAISFFAEHAESPLILVTLEGEVFSSLGAKREGDARGLILLKQEHRVLAERLQRLSDENIEAKAQRDTASAAVTSAEEAQSHELAQSQIRHAAARELSNRLGNVKGRANTERRLLNQIETDARGLVAQRRQAEERIERLKGVMGELQQELERLNAQSEISQSDDELNRELQVTRAQWEEIEKHRGKERSALSELVNRARDIRDEVEKLRARSSKHELDCQRVDLEREGILERIAAQYMQEVATEIGAKVDALITSDPESLILQDEVRQEHRAEVDKLRARILREGEVDSTSIERFEQEQQRLTDLESQKKDLGSAAHTLLQTIEHLRATSERRFVAVFEAVRSNFTALIPRLYGGGKGTIELTDPSRPLESGVDIIVRPPGKKLKTIELMSGGEKALCAIGMIVSMFLERPSPLCVLDEVDAPLDEANLMRFLEVVKEMSNQTQFLVITHNKQTMAQAEQLIGVTMQQPGASKVVTVSLQEAYTHAA